MSAGQSHRCAETEALLAERASGPVEPADAAALEQHLAVCAPCRAAAGRWEALFSAVALPPPGPREEAALRDLPTRTHSAWTRAQRTGRTARAAAVVAGLLVAAAVPLVLWPGGRLPHTVGTAPGGDADLAQVEWTGTSPWDLEDPVPADAPSEDGTLLDAFALEGEGAFSLGDSG